MREKKSTSLEGTLQLYFSTVNCSLIVKPTSDWEIFHCSQGFWSLKLIHTDNVSHYLLVNLNFDSQVMSTIQLSKAMTNLKSISGYFLEIEVHSKTAKKTGYCCCLILLVLLLDTISETRVSEFLV